MGARAGRNVGWGRRRWMSAAALMAAGTGLGQEIRNSGFEEWAEGDPTAWRVEAVKAEVRATARPGWRRLTRTFHTGPYRKLRIYVRMQSGTGTVWFDDVTRCAYFEPMGTYSPYQRRGLAGAVMHEGLRRVQRLGATAAFVGG